MEQMRLTICSVIFVLLLAVGLQCYECKSTFSMEDCLNQKRIKSCGSREEKCGNMSLKSIFSMNCFESQACEKNDMVTKACKDDGSDDCGMSCCSWDMCNDGRPKTTVNLLEGKGKGRVHSNVLSKWPLYF